MSLRKCGIVHISQQFRNGSYLSLLFIFVQQRAVRELFIQESVDDFILRITRSEVHNGVL